MYCFVIVLTLTILISWIKQTRTRKEFFQVMGWVTLGLVGVILGIAGLSQLMVYLGIAEAGFIL
jgi:hypothetical protein